MEGIIGIQARLASTRLPGKVLFNLGRGHTALSLIKERLQTNEEINKRFKICILTTRNKCDDAIENWCNENQIICMRGSQDNVLSRYYNALKMYKLPNIIRVTSDCPFLDPCELLRVFNLFIENKNDFATNSFEGSTLVDGFDVEVMTNDLLETTFRDAQEKKDLEHVTFYPRNNPDKFDCLYTDPCLNGSYRRLTLDTPEDLAAITKIIKLIKPELLSTMTMKEIIDIADSNEIFSCNSNLLKNHGW